MNRIFDDNVAITNKTYLKKIMWIMIISFVLGLVLSVVFLLLRTTIPRTLSLVFTILCSSFSLFVITELLLERVIPLKRHENFVRRLLANEVRVLSGEVVAISEKTEGHHGEPFWIMSINSDGHTYEVYLWAKTTNVLPRLNTFISLSLAENIVMGYISA